MIPLKLSVIEYFIKNERNIEINIGRDTHTLANNSKRTFYRYYNDYRYYNEDGSYIDFDKSMFYQWKRNKEIYNSPLYQAMSEEE